LPIVNVIIKELFYCSNDQILASVDEVDDEDEKDHHMNLERIHKSRKEDCFEAQRNETLQAQ